MAQNDQSCLRFSLEETIWFRKGQEVEELISISLDPEIAIEEQEHFVVIRGQLRLSGEYLSVEETTEKEEQLTSGKYVQEVRVDEEGGLEFFHGFPIDISIPKNRVDSLEDIEVSIETFDYEIPEKSCLKLTVDLIIDGTADRQIENESSPVGEEVEEVKLFPRDRRKDIMEEEEKNEQERIYPLLSKQETDPASEEGTFFAEAKRTETELSSEEIEEVIIGESSVKEASLKSLENKVEAEHKQLNYRKEHSNEQEEPEDMVDDDMMNAEDLNEDEVEASHKDAEDESDVAEEDEELEDAEIEESPEEQEKPKQKFLKKKKHYESISLKEFFARKEEEKPAKLKVCIVQNGETIDQIAQRYEVSVQQIIKENQLEATQSVTGGQVLYIPEPKTGKH